ncbi:hydrolase [Legionella dresdenensis]|uniref:Hydrolase n=1 Tax=Legionella dresdenensis TaxID=450200 RepID=A0ABV8CGR4_9GAMM
MESVALELFNSIEQRKQIMVEQLHHFCEINSGTDNLAGLKHMHQTLATAFKSVADKIETKSLAPVATVNMAGELATQRCGDALFIRKRPELKRRVLLAGHMDTVYPSDSSFQTLKYINDNQINGPGVADMKGGIIVMLHALTMFEQTDLAGSIGWDVLLNADEEIGSPASSPLYAEIAKNYQAAMVYEPAMDAIGTLARNRKGSGKLTLVATGKAAHAGRHFYEGRNAIAYLAEAITAIHALNGEREGVTINVGKIAGGEALNVVPAKAVAQLDVRISYPDDEYWVMDKLYAIFGELRRNDYSLSIHGGFGRPVKRVCTGTERMFDRIRLLAQKLGLTIDWQDSGGCCDGNNLACHGLPVIDTLGVRGGHIHSHDEFILLDSLVERTALSTLLLCDLAQNGLEELAK